RREARWSGAALHIALPAEFAAWETLWSAAAVRPRPLFLSVDAGDGIAAVTAAPFPVAHIEVGVPDPARRQALWRALLPPGQAVGDGELAQLAARFRFTPGRIAATIRRAMPEADADGTPLSAARL